MRWNKVSFSQEYFVYFKEKYRSSGAKDPLDAADAFIQRLLKGCNPRLTKRTRRMVVNSAARRYAFS